MEKEIANWIYWEEENSYYCFPCIEIRLKEINDNKEYSDGIDYSNGDMCGFMQDIADEDYEVECCKCGKGLLSNIDYNNGN